MIRPPTFEKAVAPDPGVTDAPGRVVVVVVCPGGGATVEVAGAVVVVVLTTAGDGPAAGNVVVVVADAAWPRMSDVDVLVVGSLGCVGEPIDVVGTVQVVIAWRAAGEEAATPEACGAGMTGSDGGAIALVTAPTPTQLTTVATAVATSQAAMGSGVTRRIQRFSPPRPQARTKATIIRRPRTANPPLRLSFPRFNAAAGPVYRTNRARSLP